MKFLLLSLVASCFFVKREKEEQQKQTFTQEFCSFFNLELEEFPYFYFVCLTVQNLTSPTLLMDPDSENSQSFALSTNFVAMAYYEGEPILPSEETFGLLNRVVSERDLKGFTFQVFSEIPNETFFLRNMDIRMKKKTGSFVDFLFPEFEGFYGMLSLGFDKDKNIVRYFFILNAETASYIRGTLVSDHQATALVTEYKRFREEGSSCVFSDFDFDEYVEIRNN